MRKLPSQEQKIRRAIRDVIAVDPLISVDRLRDALFDRGFRTYENNPLKWHYVARLRDKVYKQAVMETSTAILGERVTEFKEKNRLAFERLIRIAFYTDDLKKEGVPPPSFKDQISALREIVKLDLAVFHAEVIAGIFEDHAVKVEKAKRFIPIEEAKRMMILKALDNLLIREPKIIDAKYNLPGNIPPGSPQGK